ncbi:MAG: phosphotransferase family protein [Velocimicrobium sp.]
MKSITKNQVSEDDIKKLVNVNFGDSCEIVSIEELKGGCFNSAYLIERLNEKDKIVLKVSVAQGTRLLSYETTTMITEVEVYKLLAEQTTIPTPKLLAYDFSKKYIESNYFFMTALEGEAMSNVKLEKENKESIQKELANYFAQMHQIKGNYFGYFTKNDKCQFSTWKQAFLHMMEMILSDGKEHKIKLPYKRYEKQIKEKANYLEEIQEPILVNYDLHPGNIFLKKRGDNYSIEGIVDFERAFWGDPYADFPAAFLRIDDIRKKPVFWEMYKKEAKVCHDITKEEEIRLCLYRLYIFTIMSVEIYRYNFLYAKIQYLISKKVAMSCLKKLESM